MADVGAQAAALAPQGELAGGLNTAASPVPPKAAPTFDTAPAPATPTATTPKAWAGAGAGAGTGVQISIEAWDGPLALLLEEARRRRVDLTRIAMSDLVDACLRSLGSIPSTTEKLDQLLIAATLTEMKARLLLPAAGGDVGDGEEARLRARLLRLERVRAIAAEIMAQDRLGQDVFARGAPELEGVLEVAGEPADISHNLDLLELVRTYARLRIASEADAPLEIRRVLAMTLAEALELLGAALPEDGAWVELFGAAGAGWGRAGRGGAREGSPRRDGEAARERAGPRSVAAANFAAALEMARRGEVELRQAEAFGEVSVRRR